jgi:hypothetical protein
MKYVSLLPALIKFKIEFLNSNKNSIQNFTVNLFIQIKALTRKKTINISLHEI